jgi:siroheme synthase-like protein
VVVVGAGAVAARKVRGLLDAGANRIRCVAPRFSSDIPGNIERITQTYDPRHLEGAILVFATTDDAEVNATIVQDCRAMGILVNRADGEDADFSTPAMLREGDLLVTASAGSPALAAAVRDHIKTTLPVRFNKMAAAMREIRPKILNSGAPIETRQAALRDLAGDPALNFLDQHGIDQLWSWLMERHPQLCPPQAT